MSRIAVLLQNTTPRLTGTVRVNTDSSRERWPDFRKMLHEVKLIIPKKDLKRDLGISQLTSSGTMEKSYWNLSYKQGVRLIEMYEELVKQPVPYL